MQDLSLNGVECVFLGLGASISVSDELFLEEQCPMEMYSLAAVQVSLHVFFIFFLSARERHQLLSIDCKLRYDIILSLYHFSKGYFGNSENIPPATSFLLASHNRLSSFPRVSSVECGLPA